MSVTVDMLLGRRLAELRRAKHMSREDLAAATSTTAERIADFESGTLRLGVADIIGLSNALDIPIAGLFAALPCSNVVGFPGAPTPAEGHALMTCFFRIRDAQARMCLLQVAEYLAR